MACLVLGDAVGLASEGIAVSVVVLHSLPDFALVDVANNLQITMTGTELHALLTMLALCHAAGLDETRHGPRDRDHLGLTSFAP